MQNINPILKKDFLPQLIQKENFVGWTYGIDYESALVMTNDLWKAQSLGIPHNCFLVAATFDPEKFASVPEEDREVLLLRVNSSSKLPQDDDLVRTKIDYFKERKDIFGNNGREIDDITKNEMQFGGLQCRILGTFFVSEGQLWLGSDIESFATASRLNVYRPHGDSLNTIVNYVDPIRRKTAEETAKELGLGEGIKPFRIGTIRYTSTDRLHRRDPRSEKVGVSIQPSDFLARRTAVLGMTRTGKSNMIKQMVSVVKRVADESKAKIGQIIYDINGEYANANEQDKGAIADIYPDDTIRYRMIEHKDFEELQNNFYIQLNDGFKIIRRIVEDNKNNKQGDVEVFLNTSFDEPEKDEQSLYKRWRVRTAAYQAMLFLAGFPPPEKFIVKFDANANVQGAVNAQAHKTFPDPKAGLTLPVAKEWFLAARDANQDSTLVSSSGNNWLDDDTKAILNMMKQRNDNETFIKGYKVLLDARPYHSSRRSQEVGDEIYKHLVNGKIVILDLSVGEASLREEISKQIARAIFNKSMQTFVSSGTPPNIVVYIEEAHNLIGKGMDLTDTWPRLAKEGAKYRISLVYATQEVSSMHPNILANTENWFITHLNNAREIKELAQFYDFEDFSESLIRAQDVGFARVKTLSSPFVIPVQIDKFDPEAERERVLKLKGK
ncbi:MAG: ATP-binding protein [Proteobacteria bacterium]|nr:ATP-binding protein [Pseudomonadota bacterium]